MFIELLMVDDTKVTFNTDHIICFYPKLIEAKKYVDVEEDFMTTEIVTTGENPVWVSKEDYETVKKKIKRGVT